MVPLQLTANIFVDPESVLVCRIFTSPRMFQKGEVHDCSPRHGFPARVSSWWGGRGSVCQLEGGMCSGAYPEGRAGEPASRRADCDLIAHGLAFRFALLGSLHSGRIVT